MKEYGRRWVSRFIVDNLGTLMGRYKTALCLDPYHETEMITRIFIQFYQLYRTESFSEYTLYDLGSKWKKPKYYLGFRVPAADYEGGVIQDYIILLYDHTTYNHVATWIVREYTGGILKVLD